jgi:uncharacterized protein
MDLLAVAAYRGQHDAWGSVAGFTSTMAHAGDPPVAVYLLPQRLPPRVFAGTMAIVFAVMNHAKLVPYAWLGQLRAGNLLTSRKGSARASRADHG